MIDPPEEADEDDLVLPDAGLVLHAPDLTPALLCVDPALVPGTEAPATKTKAIYCPLKKNPVFCEWGPCEFILEHPPFSCVA